MVPHLGHLVHNPSGISFFLDLAEPSLGFLGNVAGAAVAGGGVTAGSAVFSTPRVFLVNEVVAMTAESKPFGAIEQETYWLKEGRGRISVFGMGNAAWFRRNL